MTLYDRLGGDASITAAVDSFYVRLLADPMLAPFFAGIELPRLKQHQRAFLSQALGGPRQYSGATMSKAHAHLCIEPRHFTAVAAHLIGTLRELGVTEELIAEVAAAITPLSGKIVNTGAAIA